MRRGSSRRKELDRNVLRVVAGHDHPWLLSRRLRADDASWVAGAPPAPGRYTAKTRYRQADAACELRHADASGAIELVFDAPQWAVTPGQSAVLYDGAVCLGGAVIASSDAGERDGRRNDRRAGRVARRQPAPAVGR